MEMRKAIEQLNDDLLDVTVKYNRYNNTVDINDVATNSVLVEIMLFDPGQSRRTVSFLPNFEQQSLKVQMLVVAAVKKLYDLTEFKYDKSLDELYTLMLPPDANGAKNYLVIGNTLDITIDRPLYSMQDINEFKEKNPLFAQMIDLMVRKVI